MISCIFLSLRATVLERAYLWNARGWPTAITSLLRSYKAAGCGGILTVVQCRRTKRHNHSPGAAVTTQVPQLRPYSAGTHSICAMRDYARAEQATRICCEDSVCLDAEEA